MKRTLHLFFGGLLTLSAWAQAPQGISYQAVLRDGNGAIEANTSGTLGIAILQGSSTGMVVYNENHSVVSNGFGLVNVVIGDGTVVSGNFANINWASGPYFVRTSFNGNQLGTSQLQSVPYALYAGSANAWGLTGNAGTTGSNFIGTTDNKPLELRVNNERAGWISPALYTNTLWGYQALNANTTGNYNVATGFMALYSNTTGDLNVATGVRALQNNTTGNYNVATGVEALTSNTEGTQNTAIGYHALYVVGSGSNNTALGYEAGPSYGNSDLSNTTALGSEAKVTANNQVRVGNTSVTSIGGQVGWTNLSDTRFKRNLREDVHGLDFVLKLRPVTYTFDIPKLKAFLHEGEGRDGEKAEPQDTREQESIRYTGFLAQEVEQAAKEVGFTFSGVDAPPNEGTPYGLRYGEFVVPLVKAVQEQQELIRELQDENAAMKEMMLRMQARLQALEQH